VLEDLVLFDSVIFCFLETNKQKKKKKKKKKKEKGEMARDFFQGRYTLLAVSCQDFPGC
jgi:hypothetical protein